MSNALALSGVSAGYGSTTVIENLSLSAAKGESVSIIGRNGVGKTTLLATIMGHTKLHTGSIRVNEVDVSGLPIFERVAAGLGYVPQEREIFPSLTVRENLQVAARPGPWTEHRVCEAFPHLAARMNNDGNQLSGGEQQILSIGRALIGNPSVLLMDEPTEGLAPVIVEELVAAMTRLRDEHDLTILLVEQNTRVALRFSERAVVLDRGRIVYDGESAKLSADDELLDSFIGVAG
jgi:branched-chain amino acid transport system ATP-binding protein